MTDKKPEVLDLDTDWQVNYPGWVISISKEQIKSKTKAIEFAAKAYQEWLDEQPSPEQK